MLSATQPNTLCSVFAGFFGIFISVGICTYRHLAFTNFVCPLQNSVKLFCRFGSSERHSSHHHFPGCTIERNHVTFAHNCVTNGELFAINVHRFRTDNCRCTPTASNHCCVTHESASSGQDAFCDHHAMDIFWTCFTTYQDHSFATSRSSSRIIGSEVDRTYRSTR